jgi:ribonuclease HI
MMLMTFWRIWHAHNELTHGKECPSIEGSRRFLVSYLNSLMLIKQFPEADIGKGKMVVNHQQGFKEVATRERTKSGRPRWKPPDDLAAKLNVDGAFSSTRQAGAGIILRDSKGDVLVAACRHHQNCQNALEAELMAIEEGLKLCLHLSQLPFTVETDSSEAIDLIKMSSPNISAYAFRIGTIRELLRERGSEIVKIGREANRASHELAKLGRVHRRTELWVGNFPREIAATLEDDCNTVAI